MRYLILVLLLSSCSSTYHLKKAIKKDPEILKEQTIIDTLKIETIDSVAYVVNDTIKYSYFKTITDTIIKTKYRYIKNPKTRQEIRLESKKEIKEIKQTAKTERLDKRLDKRIKQTEVRKSNKSWTLWLFLFFLGFFSGSLTIFILKR
tara:strand:+ start:5432 stop:5875 length:444 start_codon:yes stop_codon:yes gene_type:complete